MAFVISKFIVTFDLFGVHDGERVKPVQFNPVGADLAAQRAQLDTDIADWLDKWNKTNTRTGVFVSSSFVPSYVISEKWVWDAAAPSFAGGENVYNEAQLQSILDGKGVKYSTYIQSPDAQIFVGNSINTKNIDTGDAAYLAYGNLFVTGGICLISDGDAYVDPLNVTAAALRSVRSGKAF